MKKKRRHELGKDRVAQTKMTDICNGSVLGILAIWVVWLSTSLLIRFMQ